MSLEKIIASGNYSGNGVSQSVVIGWQPALVVIFSEDTTKGAIGYKSASMAGSDYLACSDDAEALSDGITLTATGFSVGDGDEVNRSGITFRWTAIKAGPWIDTGTYDPSPGGYYQVVTGRQPAMVLVANILATPAFWWKGLVAFSGNTAAGRFDSDMSVIPSGPFPEILITSTGFTVQTGPSSPQVYHYVCLYNLRQPTQHVESGNYVGDGSGAKVITLGYQPQFVLLFGNEGTNFSAQKHVESSGHDANVLDTNFSFESSQITISATGFTVDTSHNQSGVNYCWIAGKE
ncbi:MAG: hypothetical protein AMS21_00740 [Gemmatimonas sp. SG8_38_2]|nr:MAG: hypothetical protein AMS21_00740 [Gemmatimonas sp. SG8_38_2]